MSPRARLAANAGFTLVELLVAMVALVVITTAVFDAFDVSAHTQSRDSEYALSLQQERAGMTRMDYDIRQAYAVLEATPNAIDLDVTEGGVSQQVYYECDIAQAGTAYRQCVRLTAAVGGSLPALSSGAPVVRNVLNGTVADPVFSFTPDAISPDYVQTRLELPAGGDNASGSDLALKHRIVLLDGSFMRNAGNALGA